MTCTCARKSAFAVAAVAVLSVTTGCRGWARVSGGGAYNLPDRPRQSGQVASVDAAIGVPPIKAINGGKPLPFGVHTSGDVIIAPERKSVGWGTGVIFYGAPRPVGPYFIGGTSVHFDEIKGNFSFGNVSPYGEIGVLASVPSRYEDGGNGLFVSLGLAGATYFNYLVGKGDNIDAFALVKLGIGWEKY